MTTDPPRPSSEDPDTVSLADGPESKWNRRRVLTALPLVSLGLGSLSSCRSTGARHDTTRAVPGEAKQPSKHTDSESSQPSTASNDASVVLAEFPLASSPWKTFDPFLFCVHHRDDYPRGNDAMGPAASLTGRNLGSDFAGKDGWSMYHGEVVPGFPRHPHRGFETVTVARRGYIDHSDSLGATARYGQGDVQWMTAGRGIVHAEMFPLLEQNQPNPAELFQIWLNLPAANKMVEPHFSMFWSPTVPEQVLTDSQGNKTWVRIIAGSLGGRSAPNPPPNSWASQPGSDVAIWSIRMEAGAEWTLPAAASGVNRTLYYFRGQSLQFAATQWQPDVGIRIASDVAVGLKNGARESEVLLLQGRPIGEPIVKHGPFVMNTRDEIRQAIADYRRTGYGGWPWDTSDPVHSREQHRFAIHADGRKEVAG